jgi:hypothetical protein
MQWLKERGGSSRQAILKYIMANFNVGKDAKTVNVHIARWINNVLSSAGYVPFPTLMRIVSAHIIPYDVHEYLVFQKIWKTHIRTIKYKCY